MIMSKKDRSHHKQMCAISQWGKTVAHLASTSFAVALLIITLLGSFSFAVELFNNAHHMIMWRKIGRGQVRPCPTRLNIYNCKHHYNYYINIRSISLFKFLAESKYNIYFFKYTIHTVKKKYHTFYESLTLKYFEWIKCC